MARSPIQAGRKKKCVMPTFKASNLVAGLLCCSALLFGARQADAFDASLVAGSFDVVMGFNLLHLVEDCPGYLARMHDLLAPGGLLIIKTPCLAEPSLGLKFVAAILASAFGRRQPFTRIQLGCPVLTHNGPSSNPNLI